ncbi:MAG: hypothetical protein ACR2QM_18640 [Longimicrobiales bacterium]
MYRRIRRTLSPLALVGLLWGAQGEGVSAQESETIPGVSLGLIYENDYIPPIALMPFTADAGGEAVASQMHAIVANDLRQSDRFAVVDSIPAGLGGDEVDYTLWDQFGADWLLTGRVEGAGEGFVLVLQLHNIVFATAEQSTRIPIPNPSAAGFRLAVHGGSDRVVEWVFGEPGMAASRIVFSMRPAGDEIAKELYLIDADGENLTRVTWDGSTVASPTWAPDGVRVAYTSWKSDKPLIYERNLATERERVLEPNREGQQITPAYHPDGNHIAFSLLGGGRSGLFTFNLEDGCCLSHLSGGRGMNLQPTYSPDGRRMAFVSNRLGTRTPQIYVMPSDGGDAELLSPYRFGEGGYFADPDWSPTSTKVAFSGRIQGARTRYQILVADVQTGDHRLVQLTREGDNQDPSWAPDGRHIVFTGERSWGRGVFIVDSATGRVRTLVTGVRAEDTDWSPLLSGASSQAEAPDGSGAR